MSKYSPSEYEYKITYDVTECRWRATCTEFPSLSVFDLSMIEAIDNLYTLVKAVLVDLDDHPVPIQYIPDDGSSIKPLPVELL